MRAPDHDPASGPAPTGMKHTDFRIGMEFLTASGRWRVTDVGTGR